MDNRESRPWERKEGEPNRWYRRFDAFRLRGPSRSLAGTCNAERVAKGKQESRCAPGSWRRAALVWDWKTRAEAWDQFLSEQAAAAVEAKWKAEIMGKTEIIGRLSQMGRASHLPFIRFADSGAVYFDFSNEDAKEYIHLIKKIKTKRTRRVEGRGEAAEEWEDEWVEVELHDAQQALVQLGKHEGLFMEKLALTDPTGEKPYESGRDERFDRAISTLADAIRKVVPGAGPEPDGPMGAAE